MVAILKRQLTDDEKEIVLKRFGPVCYSNGHKIPEGDQIQFDHIRAHGLGGDSELNNIAPMCAHHNQAKGQLPLGDFRVKLQLVEFFKSEDKATLRHLLTFIEKRERIQGFGNKVVVSNDGDTIKLDTTAGPLTHTRFTCPITGWHYFYATLDVSLIDSDDEADDSIGLQPRYLIQDKVFSLFRHFQGHPVLRPAIGRVADGHIRLFDGQYKIAALLMNNRTSFECKVYIDPDL